MLATWRMLAGRRDLRLVLSAGIISLTGDWILTIGLIYRVYAVTGSTVASALTMASAFALVKSPLIVADVLIGARSTGTMTTSPSRRTAIGLPM